MEAPYPEEAIKFAEKRLSSLLAQSCRISIHLEMNESLIGIIEEIDRDKFRSELQYSVEELRERSRKVGFTLFLLTCDSIPTAFIYGYKDEEDNTFFIDTLASQIEGKGIGSILTILALVYSIDIGYEKASLYTEEVDEKGRRLVKFYQDLYFITVIETQQEGIYMIQWLNPSYLWRLCEKYLGYTQDEERNVAYRLEDL